MAGAENRLTQDPCDDDVDFELTARAATLFTEKPVDLPPSSRRIIRSGRNLVNKN